jgi:hypothetical protein
VIRRAPDTRKLDEQRALCQVAHPRWLRPVGRTETKVPARRIVRVTLEVRPVALRIGKSRSCFEQQNVQSTGGKLLRDDRAAAAGSNNNHIAHDAYLLVAYRRRD